MKDGDQRLQDIVDQSNAHAEARNQFFREATAAYLKGNGSLAAELASRGREFSELMKNKQKEAQEYIFQSKYESFHRFCLVLTKD